MWNTPGWRCKPHVDLPDVDLRCYGKMKWRHLKCNQGDRQLKSLSAIFKCCLHNKRLSASRSSLCHQTCTILAFSRPDWNIFPQPITDGVPGQTGTEWSRSSTAPMGASAKPPSNPAVDNNPDRLAAALWARIVAGDLNMPSYTPGGCCLFAFFSPPSVLELGGTGWRWINLVG